MTESFLEIAVFISVTCHMTLAGIYNWHRYYPFCVSSTSSKHPSGLGSFTGLGGVNYTFIPKVSEGSIYCLECYSFYGNAKRCFKGSTGPWKQPSLFLVVWISHLSNLPHLACWLKLIRAQSGGRTLAFCLWDVCCLLTRILPSVTRYLF